MRILTFIHSATFYWAPSTCQDMITGFVKGSLQLEFFTVLIWEWCGPHFSNTLLVESTWGRVIGHISSVQMKGKESSSTPTLHPLQPYCSFASLKCYLKQSPSSQVSKMLSLYINFLSHSMSVPNLGCNLIQHTRKLFWQMEIMYQEGIKTCIWFFGRISWTKISKPLWNETG